jgi:hypothetical protein
MEDACDFEVRCLLGAIATRMGERKVARIVFATNREWHHMVDLDGIFMHAQVNRLLADEAVSLLRAVQFVDQLVSVFGLLAGEIERTHGYGDSKGFVWAAKTSCE